MVKKYQSKKNLIWIDNSKEYREDKTQGASKIELIKELNQANKVGTPKELAKIGTRIEYKTKITNKF